MDALQTVHMGRIRKGQQRTRQLYEYRNGLKGLPLKKLRNTWQEDSNSQYQHTLSYLSVLRRQIQYSRAEADWMSGDALSWSSHNLAIWKLILCLKCSVVCRSSEVLHNMLWLEAQAAFSCWCDKDRKELQLIESDWVVIVIMFFFLLKPQYVILHCGSYCY